MAVELAYSGTQIGCTESQSITISNWSYLPTRVLWRLATPPRDLLSRLSVAGQQRLNDDLISGIHRWQALDPSTHGQQECPFSVSPSAATIQPFSTVTFTFTFYAHAPLDHNSAAFGYLVATDLPAGGHCLLHLDRLLELQPDMQPDTYTKGLPLFGGAVGAPFDKKVVPQDGGPNRNTDLYIKIDEEDEDDEEEGSGLEHTESCIVTAVCLRGATVAPSLSCLPRVLAFSGNVLPFVAHSREFVLQNLGPKPANFRIGLTSSMEVSERGQLWIAETMRLHQLDLHKNVLT